MTAPIPKTKATELVDRINALFDTGHFANPDSIIVKKYHQEIQQLMQVDVYNGHLLKAALYQTCGNVELMHDHYRILRQLTHDKDLTVFIEYSVVLANLGFFSEGQDSIRKVDDPACDHFNRIIHVGYQNFAFQHLKSLFDKAITLKLSFQQSDYEFTSKVNAILTNANVSEQQLAEYMDVAGQVLFEKKLVGVDQLPTITVADEEEGWSPPTLFISYRLAVDHSTAANLYKELTRRLFTKFHDIPDSIHISFTSAQ